MARRGGSTIQEELYSTPDQLACEEFDDARLLDVDAEKESPFLRAQKRVSASRGPLPRKAAARLLWAVLAIAVASLTAAGVAALYHYEEHSGRFRLQSSDDIEISGLSNVTGTQVMEVMGADIGRNIFFIPLDQRQKQLEQIPWVESASVMRFAPNRIGIQIHERVPVAFARIGSKIMLADASGVLMDLSTKRRYSFPVIVGMNSGEPLSTRAAQMRIYNQLVGELDSGGGRYSSDLSEVDVSDPEDVKVLTNDPEGEVLVHLGSSSYLDRFKIYVAHLREWRQQFQKLESVDLRYDRQIIVNPDLRGTPHLAPLSARAARAAVAAGVKPAALVSRDHKQPAPHPVHPAVVKQSAKSHWQKHIAVAKKVHVRTVASAGVPAAPASGARGRSAVRSSEARHTAVQTLQKPSPAISKGQESR